MYSQRRVLGAAKIMEEPVNVPPDPRTSLPTSTLPDHSAKPEMPVLAPLPAVNPSSGSQATEQSIRTGPQPSFPMSSRPESEQQMMSSEHQAVASAALQSKMPSPYANMANYGPHPGMGMPLGGGAYWVPAPGVPNQGQIIYAGNPGWLGAQPYVGPQQGAVRQAFQQVPQGAFYQPQAGPVMHQLPFANIAMGPNGEQIETSNAQPVVVSNPIGTSSSEAAAGLINLVIQGIKPGAQQPEGVFPGVPQSFPQQFYPGYMPGQFMSQFSGPQAPKSSQEQGPSEGQTEGDNQGAVRPAVWVPPVAEPPVGGQEPPKGGLIGAWNSSGNAPSMTSELLHPTAVMPPAMGGLSAFTKPEAKYGSQARGNNTDSDAPARIAISSAEGATGPDGETLYYQPVMGACSRRRTSGTHVKEAAAAGTTSGAPSAQGAAKQPWPYSQAATSRSRSGRRQHPVAEVKGNWTPQEDAKLTELVELHGVGNWSKLLCYFPGRIGKQLRERWNHELRPDINKESWTHEEECGLIEAHKQHGNCWAQIAKVEVLQGRTQNGIKNHWHATMRKVARTPFHTAPTTPLQAYLRALNKKGDEEPVDFRAPKRGPEPLEDDKSAKRAVPSNIANRDFHLRFEDLQHRSETPDLVAGRSGHGVHRRLNAEELGVAEGLLGLQEARCSPEGTDSDDDDVPTLDVRQPAARRRPQLVATQGSASRKRLVRGFKPSEETGELGAQPEDLAKAETEDDLCKTGNLWSIISNTAVAVEGLRKVGAQDLQAHLQLLAKAIKSDRLEGLVKHLSSQSPAALLDSAQLSAELCSVIRRFTGLPDLWALYDVLKQEDASIAV